MQVVCIKQHPYGILTVGKIYEIYDINACKCGLISYDIGIRERGDTICNCRLNTGHNSLVWWIWSNRFTPLEEKGEMFIEEFLVNEIEYL